MKNNFARNLKEQRIARALFQSQLAKELNTTQRRISYLENGKTEPDLDTLIAIAKYFAIPIDDLITG